MNVLILGSGGREHALAEKISKSTLLDQLFVMPGNPGTKKLATNVDINPMDMDKVLQFCLEQKIDLVIPGSEVYLDQGISDKLSSKGIFVFGPSKKAAQIETSKAFAKDLLQKHKIPTAKYAKFREYLQAVDYIERNTLPFVIKYDGLAGGKGVVIANTREEAITAVKEMLLDKLYGESDIIIEEFLEGPEFSLICFVHNNQVLPMPICQDHKRAFDDDLGPNTGGMGVYSPVPMISDQTVTWSIKNIMEKTVEALKAEGINYSGFLYGGLMNTVDGPFVIEFNCRLGDPEAEVLLPKLKTDLLEIILSLQRNLPIEIVWNPQFVLGVVMASKGYPGNYQKGFEIFHIDEIEHYYHMGTKTMDNSLLTDGGRVLFVYGTGITLKEAREKAYRDVNKIKCDQLRYRTDIGKKSQGI